MKQTKRFVVLFCTMLTLSAVAAPPLPQLTEKGIVLDNGVMGKFLFEYPTYVSAAGQVGKPVAKLENGMARVTYPLANSPELAVSLDGNTLKSSANAKDGGRLIWTMYISMNLAGKATYRLDSNQPVPLPAEQPPKAHLMQANGKTFELFDKQSDSRIAIIGSAPTFWELQDNREWNWKIFYLKSSVRLEAGKANQLFAYTFNLEQPEKVKVRVDRFGQPKDLDFPGKIKSENELKADADADKAYYASINPPEFAPWGGMPGSRAKYNLKATGFFRLDKIEGRDILVTPEGDIFFSLGVCAASPGDDFTYIKGREQIYEWIPPRNGEFSTAYRNNQGVDFSYYLANRIRKTGKPYQLESWKAEFLQRLQKWGFNTEGAFTTPVIALNQSGKFPRTSYLPSIPGLVGEIFDPFDPDAKESLDQKFQRLKTSENDPTIVGYFFSNEQHYNEIPRKIPTLEGFVPAKQELVKMLQKKYGTIQKFNQAWGVSASDFNALKDMKLQLKTQAAYTDTEEFATRFFDEYFKLLSQTFRKYDKNHLLIGTRFLNAHGNLENVVAACGKYCDVFSINYYTRAIDKPFLDRIHQTAGKPLLLSEWSFGTAEQGLAGGVIDVKNQTERGLAYRSYVEQSAALPYVVGHQWFSALDQALTGRYYQYYSGESMNIGLVNVADRPFKEFLAEVMKTNYHIYDVMLGKTAPFQSEVFIAAVRDSKTIQAPKALDGHKLDGSKEPWPGRPAERLDSSTLVLGNKEDAVNADFWLCFDRNMLYCYIEVADKTPMQNKHKNADLWMGDCIELFFGSEKPEQGGALLFSDRHFLISAKDGSAYRVGHGPAGIKAIVSPRTNGYTMEIGIPWMELGIKPEPGTRFRFDLGLDNSDGTRRLHQLMWSGKATNSSDRSAWGTATLVD